MLPNVYLARHGQTEWSLTGQHTGRTDLPLTAQGEAEARHLGERLQGLHFALVLTSPLRRARRTCELAGFGAAVADPDLVEWDYGDYEGLRTADIRQRDPNWNLFRDGCPHGETPEQVGARADRVIARLRAAGGDGLVFAHGHILCVLGARWVGLPPGTIGDSPLCTKGRVCAMTTYHYLLRDVEDLRHNWGWFLALGVLLILLGVAAIGSAVFVTVASMIVFGWFLIVGGIFQIVHAFWARRWGGFFLQLLLGVLQGVVGLLMVAHPIAAGGAVTLLMVGFFIVSGVFRMIAAASLPFEGRGWLFLSGLINLLMGIYIWAMLPEAALWVIGLFIGVDLIIHGWWLVMLALSVRSLFPSRAAHGASAVPPPAAG